MENQRKIVKKHGEIYIVSKPSGEGLLDSILEEVNKGFNVFGKQYNLKGLADFLIWNKSKDGKNMRIVCYNQGIFDDLRNYWRKRDKQRDKTYQGITKKIVSRSQIA